MPAAPVGQAAAGPAAPEIDLPALLTSWGLGSPVDSSSAFSGVLDGLLGCVGDYALIRKPKPSKDFTVPASIPITYEQATDKNFWDDLGNAIIPTVNLIYQLVSGSDASGKAYQPPAKDEARQRIVALLQPHVNDKDFMNALGVAMPQILYVLNQALGGKDYTPPPKDFFSDIGNALSGVNWGQVITTGVSIASTIASFL